MHVFLTGPVQIGKSTLIAAALDALQPERLGGFRTVESLNPDYFLTYLEKKFSALYALT